LRLESQTDVYEAIRSLKVRGAPAIGVTAAFALYLAANRLAEQAGEETSPDFLKKLQDASDYLNASRPTAVNLPWATGRMCALADKLAAEGKSIGEIACALKEEAIEISDEDIRSCKAIGENALTLLKPGMGLLTHCNAGRLATVKYGTATAAMYLGHERGYGFRIYCDETRPLLQGARLTAFELAAVGMKPTLLCDNMSASLMRTGAIDAALVGADRIAANGDTANKIGTSLLALSAKRYGVPLYICAPYSTVDLASASGADIVIEHRDPAEVTELWYGERVAPDGIDVYNPAFDVTDADLISAIITERGVITPPFKEKIRSKFSFRE
jgi:methylthioribose-1-phosphate isomerase